MTQPDLQLAAAPRDAGATEVPIQTATPPPTKPLATPAEDLVEADLLVEDVSIDGMCGVY
jgi:mycofactocin precursor